MYVRSQGISTNPKEFTHTALRTKLLCQRLRASRPGSSFEEGKLHRKGAWIFTHNFVPMLRVIKGSLFAMTLMTGTAGRETRMTKVQWGMLGYYAA